MVDTTWQQMSGTELPISLQAGEWKLLKTQSLDYQASSGMAVLDCTKPVFATLLLTSSNSEASFRGGGCSTGGCVY